MVHIIDWRNSLEKTHFNVLVKIICAGELEHGGTWREWATEQTSLIDELEQVVETCNDVPCPTWAACGHCRCVILVRRLKS